MKKNFKSIWLFGKKYRYIIILLLITISLIEIIPYLLTILFPNICYGCTSVGKFQ